MVPIVDRHGDLGSSRWRGQAYQGNRRSTKSAEAFGFGDGVPWSAVPSSAGSRGPLATREGGDAVRCHPERSSRARDGRGAAKHQIHDNMRCACHTVESAEQGRVGRRSGDGALHRRAWHLSERVHDTEGERRPSREAPATVKLDTVQSRNNWPAGAATGPTT